MSSKIDDVKFAKRVGRRVVEPKKQLGARSAQRPWTCNANDDELSAGRAPDRYAAPAVPAHWVRRSRVRRSVRLRSCRFSLARLGLDEQVVGRDVFAVRFLSGTPTIRRRKSGTC